MLIEVKNICMIESANIILDGLTVIAGENDTGKSTIGKLLFSAIKSDNIRRITKKHKTPKEILATWLNLVFDGDVAADGYFKILDENSTTLLEAKIVEKNYVEDYKYKDDTIKIFFDATLVQSPIIFDILDFFENVYKMKEMQKLEMGKSYGLEFDFSYPVVLWDLYVKITRKNPFPKIKKIEAISNKIQEIISGEFTKDSNRFEFNKVAPNKRILRISLKNTAFGIKSFGIIQRLNYNGYLNKKYLLILDEPEVHLHPEWQLKYAEIIVELVNNGIFVLINSHSPYMIQALKYYSDLNENVKRKTNFYLAETNSDGFKSNIVHKTNDLNSIFKKLAKPIHDLVWG